MPNASSAGPYPQSAYERRSGDIDAVGDDDRSRFARDRDRLIYSDAFRDLAGKSQVVASTEIGPYHNRLTHSVKVAQLGRRIAERLRRLHGPRTQTTAPKNPGRVVYPPDPDLVEFACLAHDLGHPPFGHAGEAALHDTVDALVCRTFGVEVADLEGLEGNGASRGSDAHGRAAKEHALRQALEIGGFEGNPQSFRIVTRLAQKRLSSDSGDDDDMSPQTWYGLDVCFASIDAITKYPWRRDEIATKKWGAYGAVTTGGSDLAVLEEVRDAVGAEVGDSASKSFECQVMDWCDDVTYAVHDVEDFYRVGMIPLNLIFGGATTSSGPGSTDAEWEKFRSFVAEKWKGRDGWEAKSLADRETSLDGIRQRLIQSAGGLVVAEPYGDNAQDRRSAHYRSSQLIQRFVAGVCVHDGGAPLLHGGTLLLHENAEIARQLRDECDLLKQLLRMYVIESPSLVTQRAGQRRIVSDLVNIHYENPDLLPPLFSQLMEPSRSGHGHPSHAKIRCAADYVASLTEPHAIALHRRLTGIDLGGFRDLP